MGRKAIYLASGSFWGMQKYFDSVQGILSTQVGYANGEGQAPTYVDVIRGDTGYAQVVCVRFDTDAIALEDILHLYFRVVDPTVESEQPGDSGAQYRSGIFYAEDEDKPVIDRFISDNQARYDRQIVTEIAPLRCYYPAEEYHQKYLVKHPGGYCSIGKIDLGYARNYVRGC
ncbi:MAG: peptide-methionine (S)-S-oxide reductase MsrA [Christensenellaceae bacterium]|jgi:methionine-S-sulfoxide reductase